MTIDYCPLCKKNVEYEMSGTEQICTICCRTQIVAATDNKVIERAKRMKIIKATCLVFLVLTVGTVFLGVFQIAPQRMNDAFVRGTAKGLFCSTAGLAVMGLIYLIKK
jgi:hypothetical protein